MSCRVLKHGRPLYYLGTVGTRDGGGLLDVDYGDGNSISNSGYVATNALPK
jgi:hypothetical protein